MMLIQELGVESQPHGFTQFNDISEQKENETSNNIVNYQEFVKTLTA